MSEKMNPADIFCMEEVFCADICTVIARHLNLRSLVFASQTCTRWHEWFSIPPWTVVRRNNTTCHLCRHNLTIAAIKNGKCDNGYYLPWEEVHACITDHGLWVFRAIVRGGTPFMIEICPGKIEFDETMAACEYAVDTTTIRACVVYGCNRWTSDTYTLNEYCDGKQLKKLLCNVREARPLSFSVEIISTEDVCSVFFNVECDPT